MPMGGGLDSRPIMRQSQGPSIVGLFSVVLLLLVIGGVGYLLITGLGQPIKSNDSADNSIVTKPLPEPDESPARIVESPVHEDIVKPTPIPPDLRIAAAPAPNDDPVKFFEVPVEESPDSSTQTSPIDTSNINPLKAVEKSQPTPSVEIREVVWVDFLKPYALPENYPLAGCTDLALDFSARRDLCIGGVGFGPRVVSTDDDNYEQFAQEFKARFSRAMEMENIRLTPKTSKQVIRDIPFEVHTAVSRKRIGKLMLGVQNGRCVGYWFAGPGNEFKSFSEWIGAAKLELQMR